MWWAAHSFPAVLARAGRQSAVNAARTLLCGPRSLPQISTRPKQLLLLTAHLNVVTNQRRTANFIFSTKKKIKSESEFDSRERRIIYQGCFDGKIQDWWIWLSILWKWIWKNVAIVTLTKGVLTKKFRIFFQICESHGAGNKNETVCRECRRQYWQWQIKHAQMLWKHERNSDNCSRYLCTT